MGQLKIRFSEQIDTPVDIFPKLKSQPGYEGYALASRQRGARSVMVPLLHVCHFEWIFFFNPHFTMNPKLKLKSCDKYSFSSALPGVLVQCAAFLTDSETLKPRRGFIIIIFVLSPI